MLASASGISTFQAKRCSWSSRKRGKLKRTHMMMNDRAIIFVNRINGPAMFIQSSTPSRLSHPNQANGTPHPPRNSTEAISEKTPTVANSAMKKIRKRKPEYSVMYPDTSSDSAIGMSNGGCVSSAWTAIMNTTKPMNCVRT